MAAPALNAIFDRLNSNDKDFRYMATLDLLHELKKESFRFDAETEKRLCRVILQQMRDTSGDISNLAVKCLGALVPKIQDQEVVEVSNILCEKVLSNKKEDVEQRDITSIGLKTVIAEREAGAPGDVVVTHMTPKLITALQSTDSEVVIEGLSIVKELITKFGHQMGSITQELLQALLPKLEENRTSVRKRAIQSLGVLSIHLSDAELDKLSEFLIQGVVRTSGNHNVASTFVQAIGAMSRAVGYRFGKHLPSAVPTVVKTVGSAEEGAEELMEMCLHALEGFVLRCPVQVKPYLDQILDTALVYLRHDPNFADDMEDDEDEEMITEEDDEEFSDEEFSDDEDESWKVRRAAAKCLSAIFVNNVDQISTIYSKVGPELLRRFSEREENVKLDVFNAYIDLLHQIGRIGKHVGQEHQERILGGDVPLLMKALGKQLKEKSLKTRVGAFAVLKELALVMPSRLAEYAPVLVEGVKKALWDRSTSSDLKIAALLFLKLAMSKNEPLAFQNEMLGLSDAIFSGVKERYYKVTAEALRVCREMITVIRPDTSQPVAGHFQKLVVDLFDTTMGRLGAQDQDQEVKDCAIKCVAVAVKCLGDCQPEKVTMILQILVERLKSETTRLTTVKAFNTIAQSELDLDLLPVLEPVAMELTGFLRKANMVLRQAALAALESLGMRLGSALSDNVVDCMIEEAAVLVDDKDLHLSAQSLTLFNTLLKVHPQSASKVASVGVPKAMTLVKSPLLQGGALESLRAFYAALAQCGAPNASFTALFDALMVEGMSEEAAHKIQQLSIAQCVATLCCEGQPEQLPATVSKLMGAAREDSGSGSQRLVFLCLGELGRRTDMSSESDLESVLTAAMGHKSEEIKSAASFALGAVTVGNLPRYLPNLLGSIQQHQSDHKHLYLLLQALNEVISSLRRASMDISQGDEESMLAVLLQSSHSEEECRNVVAECLGHLALIHPPSVLSVLQQKLTDESPQMRYTIITAIKYAIVDKPHPVDSVLHATLPEYLKLMEDGDRHVRKAAVQVLCSLLTHKVGLVEEHLQGLLPMLYRQTVKREDLIRVMELGPFKVKVDDGLELRKAAFECMDLLMDVCPKQVATAEFMLHLQDGLGDQDDIKQLCHPMLSKLCSMYEESVLGALDKFVAPIQTTLTARVRDGAVKQEKDRQEDMIRSCLRCVVVLNQIPGAATNPTFKRFMDNVVLKGNMKPKFQEAEKEKAEAEGKTSVSLDIGLLQGGLYPSHSGTLAY